MRSLSPVRLFRALKRRRERNTAAARVPLPATGAVQPTVYADAPLARVLIAVERRASDLDRALAEYVRARRAAGVQPEAVLVELKRLLRRAARLDELKPRLTGRLIELYFAA